jgi:hypothetical protein
MLTLVDEFSILLLFFNWQDVVANFKNEQRAFPSTTSDQTPD